MRVLILTQHYPPEPFQRPADLAQWLIERGHRVVVITGFPYYPSGTLYPGTKMRPWRCEVENGVTVIRLPVYPDHSRSVVRRVLNYGSFSFSTAILGPLLSGPIDAIYVEHPSTMFGLAAWWLSRLRRAPFVYSVDDIWPDSVEASGMLRHRTLLQTIERLEQFVYRRAGAITVISPGNRQRLIAKGVPWDKVHFVPHYANEAIYRPVARDPLLAKHLDIVARFTVMFAGHIGMAQALDVVLSAASQLTDLPEVLFLIVGDGPDAERLQAAARARGLHNVRFLGRRPTREMPYLYALADVLMVHLRDHPVFRITIPSKTMAYMACGRPLLMAVEGDAADLVRTTGAGVTCRPENAKDLAEAVRRLHARSWEAREEMGQAGRTAFLRSYSRGVLLDRYEAILAGIAR